MAVTGSASMFLSPICKCVIEIFSLAQTIIQIKYYIGIYGSMIYRSYDRCITLNAFTRKSVILKKQKNISLLP